MGIVLVLGQLLGILDVVCEEGESRRVVIVWDEMTGLGNREVLEVVASPPVATVDQISLRVSGVLHPVNLAGLRPEVEAALKIETSEPRLHSFGSVLGVELAGVDEDGALCNDQHFNIVGVVEKVVHDESLSNCRGAHLEDGRLSASVNMDSFVDFCHGSIRLSREVGDHWVLDDVPVFGEDSLVVGENVAGDFADVAHDVGTELIRGFKVYSETLLAGLDKGRDLWHVGIVKDV